LIGVMENWPRALLVNVEVSPGLHGRGLRELDVF
jgi:hypothetical protein